MSWNCPSLLTNYWTKLALSMFWLLGGLPLLWGEFEVGQEMMIPTTMALETRTSAEPPIALLAVRVSTDLLGLPLRVREWIQLLGALTEFGTRGLTQTYAIEQGLPWSMRGRLLILSTAQRCSMRALILIVPPWWLLQVWHPCELPRSRVEGELRVWSEPPCIWRKWGLRRQYHLWLTPDKHRHRMLFRRHHRRLIRMLRHTSGLAAPSGVSWVVIVRSCHLSSLCMPVTHHLELHHSTQDPASSRTEWWPWLLRKLGLWGQLDRNALKHHWVKFVW